MNQCSETQYKRDDTAGEVVTISVGNSTMTITIIHEYYTIGYRDTSIYGEINGRKSISNCCELSNFNFTFARGTDTPGVYLFDNFCGHERIKALAYYQWSRRIVSGPKETRWIY